MRHAAALLVLVAATATARADRRAAGTVVDGEHRYRLVVVEGWRPLDAAEGTLLAYRGPGDNAYFALTRVDLPGRAAWRGDEAFLDSIEQGVSSHTDGYVRVSRKLQKIDQVPVMDLRYRRSDPGGMDEVATRFVFYHTYALVLSVELVASDAGVRRQADRILASFTPYAAE